MTTPWISSIRPTALVVSSAVDIGLLEKWVSPYHRRKRRRSGDVT
jgi:hypothetical protein